MNNMSEECEVQYLSYSGWKTYNDCPLQYKWKYEDKIPVERDPRESLFGSAIGKCFEWFYERNYWQSPDPTSLTLDTIKESLIYTLKHEGFVSRGEEDRKLIQSIKNDMTEYIPYGVDNIRKHKLLSENTRVEFKLDTIYKSNKHDFAVKMGGRADFIHGMKTPWIIDGKGGSKENVDTFQLIWYATQHFLKFHVAPDRIGFLFWKSPSEPLQWVDYEEHDIRYCVKKTYETANNIRLKMFEPKTSKKCSFCPYQSNCEVGKEFVKSMDFGGKSRIDTQNSVLQIDDF